MPESKKTVVVLEEGEVINDQEGKDVTKDVDEPEISGPPPSPEPRYRQPLDEDDVWALNPKDSAIETSNRFEAVYQTFPKDKPRLIKTLLKIERLQFLYTGFLEAAFIGFGVGSPLIVNKILTNVSDVDAPSRDGYLWGFGLFLITLGRVVAESHKFLETTRASCTIRAAIQSVVYRKALSISASGRSGSSVGEISNLMQLDAESVGRFAMSINSLWSAPLQVVIAIVLLYLFIGPSSLIGLAVTVTTAPLQGMVIKKIFGVRRKAMVIADERVKLTNEILQGVKAVKFYAWEKPFGGKVTEARNREVKLLKGTILWRGLFVVLISALPTIISVVTFAFYTGVFKNELLVADVFTALLLLQNLRSPLLSLPFAVTAIVEAKVSVKRIERFLGFEDTTPPSREDKECEVGQIKIQNGSFKWGDPPPKIPTKAELKKAKKPSKLSSCLRRQKKEVPEGNAKEDVKINKTPEQQGKMGQIADKEKEEELNLTNIDTEFAPGKLTAIVGAVGSGKSSLLNAILGEMKTVQGIACRNGRAGYVPQTAWIYNATLKDNILFGEAWNEEKYNMVIKAAELEADIAMLPNGNDTAIGEKGINLSGGQKQRVSIARTLYADLDVREFVETSSISKNLKGKHFEAKEIYLFDDPLSALDARVGGLVFERVMSRKGMLKRKTRILVTNQLQFLPEVDKIIFLADGTIKCQGSYSDLIANNEDFKNLVGDIIDNDPANNPLAVDVTETEGDEKVEDAPTRGKSSLVSKGTLMSMEERKTGNVKGSIYVKFARLSGGLPFFTFAMLISVVAAGLQVLPNWWLSFWSEQESLGTTRTMGFFLGIYFMLGVSYIILIFMRSIVVLTISLLAATRLHESCLESTLSAPMSFFDVTPIGRILSRFSRDVAAADQQVPQSFLMMLGSFLSLVAAYVMIIIITPLFMSVAVPVTILYFLLQRFYNKTNIELKRLDSISKSPIYAHFAETLGGLTTIRAFHLEDRFLETNVNHIDANIRFFFAQNVCNRWFSMYLEFLGALLVLSAAVFGVLAKGRIYAGLVGLSLTYAIQIRSITDLESNMNAIERLVYYSDELPSEAAQIQEDYRAPDGWPSKGEILLDDLKLRYREGLEPALQGISCHIQPGEKIGVVGRTGAGKSTLVTALLRIVEPYDGRMEIDEMNARKLGLEELRSNITIIPQDPVVFSGSLRFNLDPFSNHEDAEIWRALEKANMKSFVAASPDGLAFNVSEYGGNLSGGQQQLLCLARALLRHPKILIMDEATSNVDFETDQLVQETIRSEFAESTIITIAHRLWTVADYDRIMVIDAGKVVEMDTPRGLLQKDSSYLSGLVDSMGESGATGFRTLVFGSKKGDVLKYIADAAKEQSDAGGDEPQE